MMCSAKHSEHSVVEQWPNRVSVLREKGCLCTHTAAFCPKSGSVRTL